MFALTSRYVSLPTSTYTTPDGRQISYVTRRFLPARDSFALLLLHAGLTTLLPSTWMIRSNSGGSATPMTWFHPLTLPARPERRFESLCRKAFPDRVMLKGIYLSLFIGPLVPLPAPKDVVDALISAQVNTGGDRSGFQLVLSLNKKSSLYKTLLPSGFFDPGTTRVILVCTLGGIPTVLIDGVVTRHELSPSNEGGQSTLTLTGEDLTVLMDVVQLPLLYPAMPMTAQLNLIVAKYMVFGIVPVIIPPIFVDVPIPTDKMDTQTTTDLTYIKAQADKCGYIFYLEPGPAPGSSIFYFGPDIRIPIPQPALTVNMDANSNVESLSFSLDGLAKKTVIMTIMDPIENRIPIPIPVPDISILRPPLGARPTPPMKIEIAQDGGNLNSIEAIGKALAKVGATSEAISGSGMLNVLRYGSVLRAHQVVGVRGAGPAYDGLYYVRTVTHNIKRGEFKQSFTLSRDGLNSLTPAVPV
jgi:hypothetical protein